MHLAQQLQRLAAMKRPLISILSLLTISILGTMSVAAQVGGGKGKTDTKKVVVAKADALTAAFAEAKSAFTKGDNKTSAKSIRAASALIGAQVKSGKPDYVQGLARSAHELESLATSRKSPPSTTISPLLTTLLPSTTATLPSVS